MHKLLYYSMDSYTLPHPLGFLELNRLHTPTHSSCYEARGRCHLDEKRGLSVERSDWLLLTHGTYKNTDSLKSCFMNHAMHLKYAILDYIHKSLYVCKRIMLIKHKNCIFTHHKVHDVLFALLFSSIISHNLQFSNFLMPGTSK